VERTTSPTLPHSLPPPPVFLGFGTGPPIPVSSAIPNTGGPPRIRAMSPNFPVSPSDIVFTVYRWGDPNTRLCLEGVQIRDDSDTTRLSWEKLSSHCTTNLRFDDFCEALVVNWCICVEDQETLDKGHYFGWYHGRGRGNEVVIIAVDEDTRRPLSKEVHERMKREKRALREREEAEIRHAQEASGGGGAK